MKNQPVLSIGASEETLVVMPAPHSLTVLIQDIDAASTTRSADGVLHRDRVRGAANAVRKLKIEWVGLSTESAKKILNAVSDEFFYVKYEDPYTNTMRVGYFYTGDRSAEVLSTNLHGNGTVWKSLSFDLIEQ